MAAATAFELEGFHRYLEQQFEHTGEEHYRRGNLEIALCITGIGSMQTAYNLSECITAYQPHFCLQAGVAGAFNRELPLTALVIVTEEIAGDLGVEDNGLYRDVFDIGLVPVNGHPFINKKLINNFQDFPIKLSLPFVTSLTVNTVSGTESTIRARAEHYGCDIESMEGAAFHYVCLRKNLPFLQVRCISNYVEPRDKSKWKMMEAIEKLNGWLIANLPV